MEPEAIAMDEDTACTTQDRAVVSIAVSLRRIADALEPAPLKPARNVLEELTRIADTLESSSK